MYLNCKTHLDIAFIVGQLSRHNSDPRAGYLRIIKQVLRYLNRTITLGIKWGRDLVGYQSEGSTNNLV